MSLRRFFCGIGVLWVAGMLSMLDAGAATTSALNPKTLTVTQTSDGVSGTLDAWVTTPNTVGAWQFQGTAAIRLANAMSVLPTFPMPAINTAGTQASIEDGFHSNLSSGIASYAQALSAYLSANGLGHAWVDFVQRFAHRGQDKWITASVVVFANGKYTYKRGRITQALPKILYVVYTPRDVQNGLPSWASNLAHPGTIRYQLRDPATFADTGTWQTVDVGNAYDDEISEGNTVDPDRHARCLLDLSSESSGCRSYTTADVKALIAQTDAYKAIVDYNRRPRFAYRDRGGGNEVAELQLNVRRRSAAFRVCETTGTYTQDHTLQLNLRQDTDVYAVEPNGSANLISYMNNSLATPTHHETLTRTVSRSDLSMLQTHIIAPLGGGSWQPTSTFTGLGASIRAFTYTDTPCAPSCTAPNYVVPARNTCEPPCHGGNPSASGLTFDIITNSCTCTASRTWSGTSCDCPSGSNWNGSSCVTCPAGYNWNGSYCELIPVDFCANLPGVQTAVPARMTQSGPNCVCTGSSVWTGSSCECSGNSFWNGSYCEGCPAGTSWNGSSCNPDPPSCNAAGITAAFAGSNLTVTVPGMSNAFEAYIAAWSEIGGQDDLQWYNAPATSGTATGILGGFTTAGTYYVHVYMGNAYYSWAWCGATALVKPVVDVCDNIAGTQTSPPADTVQSGSSCLCTGGRSWNGSSCVCSSGTWNGSVCVQPPACSGTVSASFSGNNLAVTVPGMSNAVYADIAAWSLEGSQDDLQWVSASASSGTANATFGGFTTTGDYAIHVYMRNANYSSVWCGAGSAYRPVSDVCDNIAGVQTSPPPDMVVSGSSCVCSGGRTWNGASCTCSSGTWNGSTCVVPPRPTCNAGAISAWFSGTTLQISIPGMSNALYADIAAWSDTGGQDDLQWTSASSGTASTSMGGFTTPGNYAVHVYMRNADYNGVWCGATSANKPVVDVCDNIAGVQTSPPPDMVVSGSSCVCSGGRTWNGASCTCSSGTWNGSTCVVPPRPTCNAGAISAWFSGTTLQISIPGMSNALYADIAAWSDTGGQDDLQWTSASASSGTASTSMGGFTTPGNYAVHVYMRNADYNGVWCGATSANKPVVDVCENIGGVQTSPPSGTVQSGTSCVCSGGRVWNGSACECPAGSAWNGSTCVLIPVDVCDNIPGAQSSPPPGTIQSGSSCLCTGGRTWSNATMQCECPFGTAWNGASCTIVNDACEYIDGVRDLAIQSSVPGGYHRRPGTKQCFSGDRFAEPSSFWALSCFATGSGFSSPVSPGPSDWGYDPSRLVLCNLGPTGGSADYCLGYTRKEDASGEYWAVTPRTEIVYWIPQVCLGGISMTYFPGFVP